MGRAGADGAVQGAPFFSSIAIRWLQTALLLASYPACCAVLFVLLLTLMQVVARRPIASPNTAPDMFPILVLTPGRGSEAYYAYVVYKKDLKAFQAGHPDYSFLVPEGEEGSLRGQIQLMSRSNRVAGENDEVFKEPWQAGFSVRRLGNDRQEVRVDGAWTREVVNTGWYDAFAREFVPRYHLSYTGLNPATLALLLSTVLSSLLFVGAYVLFGPRRKGG